MHIELQNKYPRLPLHKIILSVSLLKILELFYTERLNIKKKKKDSSCIIYDNRTLTNNLCSNQP